MEKHAEGVVDTLAVIFFHCDIVIEMKKTIVTRKSMTKRILMRATTSERTDDNIESLKKRFNVFETETMSVIKYFDMKKKVIKVNFLENSI